MSTKNIILIVILVAAIVIGFNGCSTYNSFVNGEQDLEQKWAEVETQYQRRFDLIPNLVETVKGYAKHESETFERVTEARAGLTQAYDSAKALESTNLGSPEEAFARYNTAQADLGRAFNVYVNAVTEAYPDLKANQQFLDLQTQLEGTENRIASTRTAYTEEVAKFNKSVKRFPGNIWAGFFGFEPRPQFKAEEGAQSAPKVSF